MRFSVLVSSALLGSTMSLAAQGVLTPPGPPAPTMKTLDQVEARIPIDAAHTPGDANATFRITAPGSYYLTGDFTGESGKDGIRVDANHVTIDLNGFTMTGAGATSAIATIFGPIGREATTVRNGSITNWGFGIFLRNKARVESVRLTDNALDALSVGNSSLIVDCLVSNNGRHGIMALSSSVVRSCVASFNFGDGIFASGGSVISHCASRGNVQKGISSDINSTIQNCSASNNGSTGIYVDDASQIMNCVANDNGTGGTGSGIRAATRAFIKQCSATGNWLNGILVAGESIVVENRASNNGRGAAAAGITTTGSGSRIDGNQTRDNFGFGIQADPNDVVIRNTAGNNSPGGNYSPATGTNIGPVSSVTAATHPFANIQF